MPNIKISDLAPIALPAVGADTFFEVQTVAAGEDVSRKISLDEILGAAGLDASFLTLSANAQLPNERVLTEGANITFVDTGPNGTLTISAAAGGVTFPLLAPDGTAGAPSYSWSTAPTTGIHLIASNLMGFSILGTTNWEMGGLFQAANNAGPAISNTAVSATVPGLLPAQQDPNTGIGSNTLDQLSLIAGGAEIARATAAFNANQFAIIQSGSSSVPELTSLADPDTGFRWPANNTTVWIGGGSRAWNFSTTKFFSQFSNGPALLNEISSDTNPTVVADHADPDTGIGSSGNDEMSLIAGGVEGIRIDEVAGNVFITYFGPIIVPTGTVGAASIGFDGDPDTGYFSPGDDSVAFTAGGVESVRFAELSSQIIQTNSNQVGLTASVTQTQAGGLALLSSYNEIATVATTGDALTAFAVVAGTRLIVINNGANNLQLFPAVGDDIGAGVDTAITIAAGDIGIFIGRDATNWDTLYNAAPSPAGGGANVVVGTVDGQVVIWDVGNNQYEPVPDSSLRINPNTPPTSPLGKISGGGSSTTDVRKAFIHINIGASVGTVWSTDRNGGTPSGFYSRSAFNGALDIHDWGYWTPGSQTGIPNFSITEDNEFIFDFTAYFEERAAALGDVAGRGQFWVRNDVPNTPMFTDDVGTDFELNASGGGIGGSIADNQVAVGAAVANDIEGTAGLTYDGSDLDITGNITLTGTVDGIDIAVDVAANTLKVTNATHTGQVTGAGALALDVTAITAQPASGAIVAGDTILINDGGVLSEATFTQMLAFFDANITITNSQVSDFDAGVSSNAAVTANTAKVTNATHTGQVTGATALSLAVAAITDQPAAGALIGADTFLVNDGGVLSEITATQMATFFGAGTANDVVQARRTTGFVLTTAFVDVTLDTTDVESDAAVLDHDLVTNTDNIIIGATGTYKVSYEVDIEVDTFGESTITADGRVRVNDGGVGLPGSDALCGVFSDGSIIADFMQNHLSQSFYVELTSGDFITLQLEKVEIGGTDTYTATRVLFTAERCL